MTAAPTPDAPRCECGHDAKAHSDFVQTTNCLHCACPSFRLSRPVSTPGEPATPSEDIGALIDAYRSKILEAAHARRYDRTSARSLADADERIAEEAVARRALDARIAALEQERDAARKALAEAAREIPWVAGPVAHRIRVLRGVQAESSAPTPAGDDAT